MALVDDLIQSGYLKTQIYIDAFRNINRKDFLPNHLKDLAELNQALPIGFNQTISQPLVVAFMLEELQPKPGDIILDIGFGSGWTSALLSNIVGPSGSVVAVEIIEDLCRFGRDNLQKLSIDNIECICGDWQDVVSDYEQFDGIEAACATDFVPLKLKKILKIGGRLVLPIEHDKWGDQSIRTITKISKDRFEERDHPGFMFVPMI